MEEQITLTSIGSGLIAIIGLYFFYKRLKNQDIQRVDDRFNSAINLLGPSSHQKYQLVHRLTPHSVWRVSDLVCFCLNVLNA
jgi:hypothetical protein